MNSSLLSDHHQALYENTYWKQWGIPKDIFTLVIQYLAIRCGFCANYIHPWQNVCDKCIDEKETYIGVKHSEMKCQQHIHREKVNHYKNMLKDCKNSIEKHNAAINGQLDQLYIQFTEMRNQLNDITAKYSSFKTFYELIYNIDSQVSTEKFLMRAQPEKVNDFEIQHKKLEDEYKNIIKQIRELKEDRFKPYNKGKCLFKLYYSAHICTSSCEGSRAEIEERMSNNNYAINEIQRKLDVLEKQLYIIHQFKRQNRDYLEAIEYARAYDIKWDTESFAYADLFNRVEEHKKEFIKN